MGRQRSANKVTGYNGANKVDFGDAMVKRKLADRGWHVVRGSVWGQAESRGKGT